jgi:hypothetical protein
MFKKYFTSKSFIYWLILVIAITFTAGTAIVSIQQVLRQSANDPQIQIAEDISLELSKGVNPAQLDSPNKTDIDKNLDPFLLVFDRSGKSLATSAALNGVIEDVPLGALQASLKKSPNLITWQPQEGVRSALAVIPFAGTASTSSSGFVVIGRSLRVIESRISKLEKVIGFGWLLAIVVTFVITLFGKKILHRNKIEIITTLDLDENEKEETKKNDSI